MAARGFADAADAAFEKQCAPGYVGYVRGAVVFLYARSIELSLKASLRQHTSNPKTFGHTLGHRLDLILKELRRHGAAKILRLSRKQWSVITGIGEDYSDKWFEYPDNIWTKRPRIEELRDAATYLAAQTQSYVARKNSKIA
jgi:hypothetical protein